MRRAFRVFGLRDADVWGGGARDQDDGLRNATQEESTSARQEAGRSRSQPILTVTEVDPALVDPNSAKLYPMLGRHPPNLADLGPPLVEVGPLWIRVGLFGQIRANIEPRANLADS